MSDTGKSGKVTALTLLNQQLGLERFLNTVKSIKAPALPNTQSMTTAQKFDAYAKYVESHGSEDAKKSLKAGDQVIVSLRMLTDTRENRGEGAYDDRMVIIWQTVAKPPVKHAKEFIANTEPSAQYEQRDVKFVESKRGGKPVKVVARITAPDGREVKFNKDEGVDVDANGRLDLGRLKAGVYKFYDPGGKFLEAAYLRPRNSQTAERDTDHDGRYTVKDSWQTPSGSALVHTGAFAMYLHKGGRTNTWSAGCQTLPPAQHTDFFKTLGDKKPKQTDYYYVLVEMEWEWAGKH